MTVFLNRRDLEILGQFHQYVFVQLLRAKIPEEKKDTDNLAEFLRINMLVKLNP